MSLVGYTTASDIVNRAAVQVGLAVSVDPFASTDPNFIKLVEYLNTAGQDIAGQVKKHLKKRAVAKGAK